MEQPFNRLNAVHGECAGAEHPQVGTIVFPVEDRTWIEQWWPVVATGVAVAGIVIAATIAITIYRKNRPRHTLDYDVIADIALLSHNAPGVEGLEIMFRSRTLEAPRVVTIGFMNTGNKSIEAKDFRKNIVVKRGDSAKALNLFVVEESVPDMIERLSDGAAGSLYVDILPVMMNPNDYFVVQFLYDGDGEITVSSWFKDQSRPMKLITASLDRAAIARAVVEASTESVYRFVPFGDVLRDLRRSFTR
ncbi:hypothetical protein [Rhodococcus sp. IEGM1428]|uniref:hypothetical protein n=1 Tax=Rhodococcus sp. IEGM1428 TaxID=3392191 RepID=UPI003D09E554